MKRELTDEEIKEFDKLMYKIWETLEAYSWLVITKEQAIKRIIDIINDISNSFNNKKNKIT